MNKQTSLLNLQDKVAIVTGAATGLGAATAQLLSKAGVRVLINHMPGQTGQGQRVAEECETESLCYAADITQDKDCKAMVQAAIDLWGRVDILINNAGFNRPVAHDDLDGLSAQDFIDLYQVHVIGAYQMIRAVAPAMQSQGKGVVVNVSSRSGESGNGSSVAYAASKGAMNTLTKSLARALAPAIRINAVCPGMVMTPIWDKLNHSKEERDIWRKEIIATIPLQTEPTAEIIAKNILYLASDLAAHLAGQLLNTDGGASLGLYQPTVAKDDLKGP